MSSQEAPKKWYKLDNAAKIYPAAKSGSWTALFRVSATLNETVDPDCLQEALVSTTKRFPSFALRLRRGLFWYYLEEIRDEPRVQQDVANPCVRMDLRENGGMMFRVRWHENRIALEVFHVLSDGTGGMTFLKTLVAEYLRIKHGAKIPRGDGILDCSEAAAPSEYEDAFFKYSRSESLPRKEDASYRIHGTPEVAHYMDIITGMMPVEEVKALAKGYGVTITELLVSLLIQAICTVQKAERSKRLRRMPVKICVPVNLRKFYPTDTVRNFSSFINPGITPRLGDYTLEETLKQIKSLMGYETSEKMMNARMSTNVLTERNMLLRAVPLFLKNPTMSLAFKRNGDRTSSTTISNLGNVTLPGEMAKYVDRVDFMLGPLKFNPVTCACASYNGRLVINFTRTIKESDVERFFFTSLVKLGVHVTVESNRR